MKNFSQHAIAQPSILSQALNWWLGELAGWAHSFVRSRRRTTLLLINSADSLEVCKLSGGSSLSLGRLSNQCSDETRDEFKAMLYRVKASRMNIVLRLIDSQVLQRSITIPTAARSVLKAVVANQIERLAPWPLADTRYGYAIAVTKSDGTTADDGHLHVTIVATSHALLCDAIAKARAIDLDPSSVDFAEGGDTQKSILLYSRDATLKKVLVRKVAIVLSMIALGAMAAGAMGIYRIANTYAALSDIRNEVSKTRGAITLIEQRNALAAKRTQRSAAIIARKTRQPAAAVTLEVLSRSLPDSTWLTKLQLRQEKVILTGRAENAAALVSTLEEKPYFKDVRFSAPTTRTDRGTKETYSITANVSPGATLED